MTLVRGLPADRCTPVVATADASPDGLIDQCRTAGVLHVPLGCRHWRWSLQGLGQYLADLWHARRVLRPVIREFRPDVVHVNGCRGGLIGVPMTPRRTPVVIHARDLSEPRPVRRLLAGRAAAVVAISECVARRWQVTRGAGRVRVIYNGLDVDAVAAARPTPRWPWSDAALTLVMVADFVEWKRHDLFLDALAAARSQEPGLRAVVVGRARTAVTFVTGENDAVPWIAAADVLVSTAVDEPFGRTVVEALALGKPVIAVGASGPEEILGDCAAGTLVPPTSDAIAAAILRWRNEEDRRRVAAEAVSRARLFRVGDMVTAVCALYAEVCGRGGRLSVRGQELPGSGS
jgi:glycosyltransferase involved in cell wall biosynthesis